MKIFDFYLLKSLTIATAFIAVVLTFIIFLTQSLKFLEIVINSESAGYTFWVLTSLALPRFFEVILPLSLMSATLFLYHKMIADSELIAMKGIGHSSFALARPAIILGVVVTVFLWGITMWGAPISLSKMQSMRMELKEQFSTLLFREGVNAPGKGLTVYIRKKNGNGELEGLMIHDTRDKTKPPTTIMAKRGLLVADETGHQVIVYNGVQHEYNRVSGILQTLTYDRYTIELPDSGAIKKRWAEPDERTITQLLNPDPTNKRDVENERDFKVEIHRRITGPLLAITFPLIALTAMLLGPIDRKGQSIRIGAAVLSVMLLQGLFLASYNLARNSEFGLILMYLIVMIPIILTLFSLSGLSENLRRRMLYKNKESAA